MDTAEDAINLTSKLEFLIFTSFTLSIRILIFSTTILTAVRVQNNIICLGGDPGWDVWTYFITFTTSSDFVTLIINKWTIGIVIWTALSANIQQKKGSCFGGALGVILGLISGLISGVVSGVILEATK